MPISSITLSSSITANADIAILGARALRRLNRLHGNINSVRESLGSPLRPLLFVLSLLALSTTLNVMFSSG